MGLPVEDNTFVKICLLLKLTREINLFRRKRVFLQSRLSVQRLLNVGISVVDVMGEEDCSLRNHGDYTYVPRTPPFVKHSKRKKLKVRHGPTRPLIPL